MCPKKDFNFRFPKPPLEALDKKEYKKALGIFKQLAKDVIEGC